MTFTCLAYHLVFMYSEQGILTFQIDRLNELIGCVWNFVRIQQQATPS